MLYNYCMDKSSSRAKDKSIKVDRRTRYTRDVIKSAFIELLEKKPINKISVASICEKAEINRGTFYIHYRDVYDLQEQVEEEFRIDIMSGIEYAISVRDIDFDLTGLITTIRDNGRLCKILFGKNADTEFVKRMIYDVKDKCMASWRDKISFDCSINHDRLFSFVGNGAVGIIEDWIGRGMVESPEVIGTEIRRLARSCIALIAENNTVMKIRK